MPTRLGLSALKVLQALATGSEYGFDIIDATGLPSGTVYPALSWHERQGYVRSSWEDLQKAHDNRRPPRRYYRMTPEGRRALSQALTGLGFGPARKPLPARAKG